MSRKLPFVVLYDYGIGGIWATMYALSEQQIHSKYPELTVFLSPPDWMSQEDFVSWPAQEVMDIDAAPSGWLARVLKDRGSEM